MKRFEFRLSRVLDFRREQGDVERSRLQALLTHVQRIESEKAALVAQASDAREKIGRSASVLGEELTALCEFERHTKNRSGLLDQERRETQVQIRQQQTIVLEAERKVALLVKLRQRQLIGWTVEEQKELEALAAESYISRLCADRRDQGRAHAGETAVVKR